MLRTENLRKSFGPVEVLKGIDVAVEPGEIVGLVGPNGSGKTTLLNCLAGLYAPTTGRVWFGDKDITSIPAHGVSALGVRRTFQHAAQPMLMTVLEAMLCGAVLPQGESVRGLFRARATRAEERAAVRKALDLLDFLNLTQLRDHPAGQLSGGQQKLLSIGVALMSSPRILLMDEPTAGVNPALRGSLIDRLVELRERGTGLLVIEHDMHFIGRLCSRVVVLDKGEEIASCRPSELADNPRVVEAYLGTRRQGVHTTRRAKETA